VSADEHLNDNQFSYFRGLYLGDLSKQPRWVPPGESHVGIGHHEYETRDPQDDEHVLSKLKQHPDHDNPNRMRWAPYGSHWTADEHLAKKFALDPTHGKYRSPRPPRGEAWGAVLEAKSNIPPEVNSLHSNFGETEVDFPHRDHITSVQMHVHKFDPEQASQDPKWRRKTYERTIEIPEEHWRNA
jgi:hypothetical protein